MLEIVLGIALCVVMGKIADADNRSALTWGFITFGLCAASVLIPLPFLRFLLAGIVSFGLMIAMNYANK